MSAVGNLVCNQPKWDMYSLGSLCSVIAGQSPKSSTYNDTGEGLPFYQGKKQFTDRYLSAPTTWTTEVTKVAEPKDILMSVRAPVGPVNETREPICIGRGLAAIRAGREVNRGFLWYALLWLQPTIAGNAGAVFPSISKKSIESLAIPLPPLEEQKRIVAVLDRAFAALDRARANAEANLADAQKLFESSVDALLNHDRSGWREGRFEDVVGEVYTGPFGSLLHKNDYIEGGTPIVNPSNIVAGVIEPDWTKTVSKEAADRLASYKLRAGDLVIGRRGEMGRCAPVLPHMDGWLCGTGSFIIRPKPGVSSEFVGHLMRTSTIVAKLTTLSTGTTMLNLSNRAIAGMQIELPIHKEQLSLLRTIKSLEAHTRSLQSRFILKSEEVADLRQSILQKAFTGRLT